MGDTTFEKACRGEPVDRIPVWLMRQAGRYMKAYRDLKDQVGGFWELCRRPKAAAQATLDAANYLDTDAAIIFSDITLPAWGMGLDLVFDPGPKFSQPPRTLAQVEALEVFEPREKLSFVMEAIEHTRAGLPDSKALIGFVGAPLTLSAYMVEGYPSRNWVTLKRLVYGEPEVMHALLEKVSEVVAAHAIAQVEAGCDTLQFFDTSAGLLAPDALHGFAFAYVKKAMDQVRNAVDVPLIYFARDIGAHLEAAAQLGSDILGVDWTVTMAEARRRVGPDIALQGNLDPGVLFTSRDEVVRRTQAILEECGHAPGFVFNLGHGVLPETPPENVKAVVDTVHAFQP